MSLRLAVLLSSALLLGGCSSSFLDVFNFSGSASDDEAREERAAAATPASAQAPAPAPVGAQGAPDPFCASVARQDAMTGAFDTATQQRMAQRDYQQCVAMFRSQ